MPRASYCEVCMAAVPGQPAASLQKTFKSFGGIIRWHFNCRTLCAIQVLSKLWLQLEGSPRAIFCEPFVDEWRWSEWIFKMSTATGKTQMLDGWQWNSLKSHWINKIDPTNYSQKFWLRMVRTAGYNLAIGGGRMMKSIKSDEEACDEKVWHTCSFEIHRIQSDTNNRWLKSN